MSTGEYFDSPAIGSSLLGNFIKGQDYALKEVKPTGFMEMGKIFEDLIEEEATGNGIFTDKYFSSSINNFPTSTKKDIKDIFEILDGDNIADEIKAAYVRKEDGDLNNRYRNRHNCLDQILGHACRRPIPAPLWEDIKAMLANFKLAVFNPPEMGWEEGINLFDMISSSNVKFQQEHFWSPFNGVNCRMKSDIEVFWDNKGFIADLKVTANFNSFRTNWINKYVWQAKHYLTGFRSYCLDNGITPPETIWYFVQESTEPYILHQFALSPEELDAMTERYEHHIEACQKWIDAGKPKKGFSEAQHVDKYLRPI